jgi:hypothetical protein
MNLNGRVDKLLAEVRKLQPTQEVRDQRAEFEAWWHSLFDVLRTICQSLREGLQEAFVERIERHMDAVEADKSVGLCEDGFFYWASKYVVRDALPLPGIEVIIKLAEAYLADPLAWPHGECGECGLIVPTSRNGKEVYFPVCPACGGATGSMAWWYSSREAARGISEEAKYQIQCGADPLPLLIAAGYQPGTRLSDWEKRRQQEV